MVEVNGRGIEDVDRFVYLGATVSKEGGGIGVAGGVLGCP